MYNLNISPKGLKDSDKINQYVLETFDKQTSLRYASMIEVEIMKIVKMSTIGHRKKRFAQ